MESRPQRRAPPPGSLGGVGFRNGGSTGIRARPRRDISGPLIPPGRICRAPALFAVGLTGLLRDQGKVPGGGGFHSKGQEPGREVAGAGAESTGDPLFRGASTCRSGDAGPRCLPPHWAPRRFTRGVCGLNEWLLPPAPVVQPLTSSCTSLHACSVRFGSPPFTCRLPLPRRPASCPSGSTGSRCLVPLDPQRPALPSSPCPLLS